MTALKYKPIVLLTGLLFTLLFSCQKTNDKKVFFNNVLILGNSITKAGPNPSIGWNANWGMASSSADSDYVHLLTGKLREQNPAVQVKAENIVSFEVNHWQYDFSLLNPLVVSKPDLIILRIGENVDRYTVEQHQFKQSYKQLIQYLKQNNPDVKIICVGSFWKIDSVENAIQAACLELNLKYVRINSLDDIKYMAWNEFSDPGIRIHPSNKGMKAIADSTWTAINKL